MVNGKKKGNRGELEVAKLFKQYGYTEARRSQQYCGDAGDADVIGVPGLHLEVKRRQASEMRKFIEQAERDCIEDSLPIVCYRDDRKPWVAVMRWDVFYKWLGDAYKTNPFIDTAVANAHESGKYVFMYLDRFIEMFNKSKLNQQGKA